MADGGDELILHLLGFVSLVDVYDIAVPENAAIRQLFWVGLALDPMPVVALPLNSITLVPTAQSVCGLLNALRNLWKVFRWITPKTGLASFAAASALML